jgi:hypothetical protein
MIQTRKIINMNIVANIEYSLAFDSLANKFAASFPLKAFSQADIQGYLFKYPKSPELAVERVCDWIHKELDM